MTNKKCCAILDTVQRVVRNCSELRNRGVEQSVARRAHNPKVASSSLASATNADVAQSAERVLGKDEVSSSILDISSIFLKDSY